MFVGVNTWLPQMRRVLSGGPADAASHTCAHLRTATCLQMYERKGPSGKINVVAVDGRIKRNCCTDWGGHRARVQRDRRKPCRRTCRAGVCDTRTRKTVA